MGIAILQYFLYIVPCKGIKPARRTGIVQFQKPCNMKDHLILNGLTVEELSEMIREAVREEMQQLQLPN